MLPSRPEGRGGLVFVVEFHHKYGFQNPPYRVPCYLWPELQHKKHPNKTTLPYYLQSPLTGKKASRQLRPREKETGWNKQIPVAAAQQKC